ncbi:MAG: hypothetical protein CL946_13665 [Ectothiorhodospiraceae bacterium]|nr:hypothetical protein [Ectothiorhodospiraceae bacterium]
MATLKCSRCGQEREAVTNVAFYTGDVKDKLMANACQVCWDEWIKMQIMIINEYRLNLMDPKTDEFLNKQVLAFFNLDGGAKQASVDYVPPEGAE